MSSFIEFYDISTIFQSLLYIKIEFKDNLTFIPFKKNLLFRALSTKFKRGRFLKRQQCQEATEDTESSSGGVTKSEPPPSPPSITGKCLFRNDHDHILIFVENEFVAIRNILRLKDWIASKYLNKFDRLKC